MTGVLLAATQQVLTPCEASFSVPEAMPVERAIGRVVAEPRTP
jgi:hypothetical protein